MLILRQVIFSDKEEEDKELETWNKGIVGGTALGATGVGMYGASKLMKLSPEKAKQLGNYGKFSMAVGIPAVAGSVYYRRKLKRRKKDADNKED